MQVLHHVKLEFKLGTLYSSINNFKLNKLSGAREDKSDFKMGTKMAFNNDFCESKVKFFDNSVDLRPASSQCDLPLSCSQVINK